MSWIEQISAGITITTGDGKEYTPQYLKPNKGFEFNVAEFEYIDVEGTYVPRKKRKGRRFILELYFQGEDHLQTVEAFEKSSLDPNPWKVSHPLYGQLTVQPMSVTFDDEIASYTKVVIPVVETIVVSLPQSTVSAKDVIAEKKLITDEALTDSYISDVKPKTKDYQAIKANANTAYQNTVKKIKTTLDNEAYLNSFNTANRFIDQVTKDPLDIMRQVQKLISAPALFADSVRNRLNTLISQFNALRSTLAGALTFPAKKLYENNMGTIISSLCQAAVTNITPEDYSNRGLVVSSIELLVASYNQYIEDISGLQAANGSAPNNFIPNGSAMQLLSQLITYTIANLFEIASQSKQERSYLVPNDTTWVNLAKRFYGLKTDDSTISLLIEQNNVGPAEILLVPKGKTVVYYV